MVMWSETLWARSRSRALVGQGEPRGIGLRQEGATPLGRLVARDEDDEQMTTKSLGFGPAFFFFRSVPSADRLEIV